ncbi:MAG: Flp pilus assembly complex ATPase component TadA [Candidatus Omnitrophica bacterium]|nr:Flp pilus assembly complex ATPase component TadA [Candidatus Omnitrophota bacterium]
MAKISLEEKIKKTLLDSQFISKDALDKAIQIQKNEGGLLSKILVKQGAVSEEQLMSCLASQLNLPIIKLSKYKIDFEVLKIIPEQIASHYLVIPLSKIGNTLTIAMADPLNIFALDDIKSLTSMTIKPIISTPDEVKKAIRIAYGGVNAGVMDMLNEAGSGQESELEHVKGEVQMMQVDEKVPVIRMVGRIIDEGLKQRASDIHLEPYLNILRIRYRVDGELQEAFEIPKKYQNALIARLKIMSNLDITERRLPQDGRFKVKFKDKEIDFRVSCLPIAHGEKIVMRALDKSNLSVGLEKLGFLSEPLEAFKRAVLKPYGMILVTGPTGSGKSTTLYSILNQLNKPKVSLMTIEDPVEYQLEGITQVQVKPEIGLTFAGGLRSILRQSPDVIMVGEIRDSETADIAIKSSLTGLLIFSTLHTNDAAGAITRLVDMGIEPFLIASSLILVVAQRLCRRVCSACRREYRVPMEVLKKLGINVKEEITGYQAQGCKQCNNTGYMGRMGTIEVMEIDEEIKNMILAKESSDRIKEYAVSKGMKTLWENAVKKFLAGQTTIEEVLRITSE